jgi:hypothetical protein
MRRIHAAAMVLAIMACAPAGAAERLIYTAEPGFVVGFRAANANEAIEEWVPKGETVQNWTRMLTFQRFPGLVQRGRTGPELLDFIAGRIASVCPGAKTMAIVRSIVPDAAAEKKARDYLASVVLCGNAPNDAQPICKAK